MRVGVIVVTWNAREQVLSCLASIDDVELIVVVDNGSTDDTIEAVRCEFPTVHLIELPRNYHFAAGANAGMRYALHQGMDAVLLLNNDARLLPGSLAVLCHVLQEHPAIGIVGARLEHPDGRVVVGADCDWHTAAIYEPLPPYRAPLIGVDYVWGTAMLIRSDVLRTIGLFDESYIAYFEDMDLCMRARAAGWHIVGVRDAPVWHAGSATANRSFLQQMWLRGRNWARCFLQHAPPSPRLWFWLFGVRLPHLVWSTLVTILVWTVRRKEFRL